MPICILHTQVEYSPLELLLTAVVLLSYVLFSALFGLLIGLMTANMTWTNEVTPIKQTAGVKFAMLSGFAYAALLCGGFMLFDGWKLGFTGYGPFLWNNAGFVCPALALAAE